MRPICVIMSGCALALALQGCTVVELIRATIPASQTVPMSDRVAVPGEVSAPVAKTAPKSDAPAQAAMALDSRRVTIYPHIKVSPQGVVPVLLPQSPPKAGDHTIELVLVNFYGLQKGFSPTDVDTVSVNIKAYGENGDVKGWKALNVPAQGAKLQLTETKERLTGSIDTSVTGYDTTAGETKRVRFVFDLPYSP